ncbi:hypothetical protein [Mycobacterium phage WXIN]|nr:hypothetical protein [Mycobacterium phage WXIN]
MALRACAVCDSPIEKGEPRVLISGQSIHQYCDLSESNSGPCQNENCAYRWTYHAGGCCD